MCALKNQDQGIIELSQTDYLPILIDSFLIDRKAQGFSGETVGSIKRNSNTFRSFVMTRQ